MLSRGARFEAASPSFVLRTSYFVLRSSIRSSIRLSCCQSPGRMPRTRISRLGRWLHGRSAAALRTIVVEQSTQSYPGSVEEHLRATPGETEFVRECRQLLAETVMGQQEVPLSRWKPTQGPGNVDAFVPLVLAPLAGDENRNPVRRCTMRTNRVRLPVVIAVLAAPLLLGAAAAEEKRLPGPLELPRAPEASVVGGLAKAPTPLTGAEFAPFAAGSDATAWALATAATAAAPWISNVEVWFWIQNAACRMTAHGCECTWAPGQSCPTPACHQACGGIGDGCGLVGEPPCDPV